MTCVQKGTKPDTQEEKLARLAAPELDLRSERHETYHRLRSIGTERCTYVDRYGDRKSKDKTRETKSICVIVVLTFLLESKHQRAALKRSKKS